MPIALPSMLAQVLTEPPVPLLPDPPAIEHYLLESPWMACAVLVIAGFVGLIVLNRQGKAGRGVQVAGAGILLAAVVFVLATVVKTEREALAERTLELVARTATVDTAGLSPLLSDRVAVSTSLALPIAIPVDKATLLDSVRKTLGESYRIEKHTTGRVRAVIDGQNTARTQVRVWVTLAKGQAYYDAPVGSWWRIEWRKEGDEWRVVTLTLQQVDGLGGGSK